MAIQEFMFWRIFKVIICYTITENWSEHGVLYLSFLTKFGSVW